MFLFFDNALAFIFQQCDPWGNTQVKQLLFLNLYIPIIIDILQFLITTTLWFYRNNLIVFNSLTKQLLDDKMDSHVSDMCSLAKGMRIKFILTLTYHAWILLIGKKMYIIFPRANLKFFPTSLKHLWAKLW